MRRVLGEDGDAALSFEVVGVHDALGDGFIGAEGAGLAQHGVDEGGLAVVDVGDDGDVADGLRCGAHWREILSYEIWLWVQALRGVQMRVGAKRTQLIKFTADGVALWRCSGR